MRYINDLLHITLLRRTLLLRLWLCGKLIKLLQKIVAKIVTDISAH